MYKIVVYKLSLFCYIFLVPHLVRSVTSITYLHPIRFSLVIPITSTSLTFVRRNNHCSRPVIWQTPTLLPSHIHPRIQKTKKIMVLLNYWECVKVVWHHGRLIFSMDGALRVIRARWGDRGVLLNLDETVWKLSLLLYAGDVLLVEPVELDGMVGH